MSLLLISTISSFYHEKEIVDARSELFKVAMDFDATMSIVDFAWAKPITNKTGQLINRRGGDEKSKEFMDTEDILHIFSMLDVCKVAIPRYVVEDTSRIPPAPFVMLANVPDSSTSKLEKLSWK